MIENIKKVSHFIQIQMNCWRNQMSLLVYLCCSVILNTDTLKTGKKVEIFIIVVIDLLTLKVNKNSYFQFIYWNSSMEIFICFDCWPLAGKPAFSKDFCFGKFAQTWKKCLHVINIHTIQNIFTGFFEISSFFICFCDRQKLLVNESRLVNC